MEQSDRPGRELPKEYREVATELVDRQGWRYNARRNTGGHPQLLPADRSQTPITVPTTPGDVRSFRNFVSQVRRSGGQWPVKGKKGKR